MSDSIKKKRQLPKWMEILHHENNSNFQKSNNDQTLEERIDVVSTQASSRKCAGDIVAMSMPLLHFRGTIVYSLHHSDCACICENILTGLSATEKTVIGFDIEWSVSYQKNSKDKTALIQMCLSENTCYLFHVAAMTSFPKTLESLILDDRVLLIGLNIVPDLWKLARDFGVNIKIALDRGSVVDVGTLANQKLKTKERWSLDGLCRNILACRLDKNDTIRCGHWTHIPLRDEQKSYAATDAFTAFLIYKHLHEK